MLWMLCAWSVVLLSAFARGHNTPDEGYTLSPSGYHVCPGIEMVPMTTVVSYKSAYTQMVPCGGWLPWKSCNVTRYTTVYQTQVVHSETQVTKCCKGYEQVGSYCALVPNRSSEFTAKPGLCPVRPVSGSGSGCNWDTDCPGWQKCCQTENWTLCVEPQTHVNMSSWLNVTVTVKAAYTLINTSSGIFNHTRLLHAVLTGALSYPQVSVYHTHSWSSGRFSTSSCLLLGSSQLLSLTSVSDTLLLLLENIEEVTAVDIRDVDECATPLLRECSPLAYCNNTLGSYTCSCAAGSADLQPSRPGTQCMSIPKITNLCAKNVTSSSFKLLWDVPSRTNVTSTLVLFHGTHQLGTWVTPQSEWTWTGLQPGLLYTARVALCVCGDCGNATELEVKTDAEILKAVARITNVEFTDALLNPDREEYKMLSERIRNETLHYPPSWILDLVHAGKLMVLITDLSPGSVMVTFSLVFLPNSTQDIFLIASELMTSLQKSALFTVDPNSIHIMGTSLASTVTVSTSTAITSTTTSVPISTASLSSSSSSTDSTPVTQGTDGTVGPSTAAPSLNQAAPSTTSSSSSSSSSSSPQSTTSIAPSTMAPDLSATSTSESITVECGPGYMIVSVSRYFLDLKHILESSLYLGLPSCNHTERNVTHIKLSTLWGACGTQLRNNSQNSTVQVTLSNADARLQVLVICSYINSFSISMGYSASGFDSINNVVEGSGMYQVTVRLLNGTDPLPQNYTLSPEDEVTIEVGLSSNMSQIKVVINKCWANPSSDPAQLPSTVFLENSCPVPLRYTTVLRNGESTHSLLAVNLYHLVEFDIIYLHCQIQICIETTATCRPVCTTVSKMARSSRGANMVGTAKASYGPLLKSRPEETLQDTVWNIRTIGFILLALGVCVLVAGCVAVVMFCRRRIGNYNFQFKPREEKFTYHVFDT